MRLLAALLMCPRKSSWRRVCEAPDGPGRDNTHRSPAPRQQISKQFTEPARHGRLARPDRFSRGFEDASRAGGRAHHRLRRVRAGRLHPAVRARLAARAHRAAARVAPRADPPSGPPRPAGARRASHGGRPAATARGCLRRRRQSRELPGRHRHEGGAATALLLRHQARSGFNADGRLPAEAHRLGVRGPSQRGWPTARRDAGPAPGRAGPCAGVLSGGHLRRDAGTQALPRGRVRRSRARRDAGGTRGHPRRAPRLAQPGADRAAGTRARGDPRTDRRATDPAGGRRPAASRPSRDSVATRRDGPRARADNDAADPAPVARDPLTCCVGTARPRRRARARCCRARRP